MKVVVLVCALVLAAATIGGAEPVKVTDPKDQEILAAFLKRVETVPEQINPAYCKQMAADQAEGYVWLIMPFARMPLTAYRITEDPKYLDMFVQVFDNMRGALTKGPDGFLGWRGKALDLFQDPEHPGATSDVMISDFSAVDTVSQFLEIVAAQPALAKKYAPQRAEYLDLLENHFVKKWDVRGNYVDLGAGGAIYRSEAGLKYDKALLTQPHNKQSIALRALLSLYRVTGKDEHMRKAIKLGIRYKHSLTLRDGHYEWDYWDPAGAWDINPKQPATWKHWIGPEHKGGYYSSTLSQAVALYDYGLVFDKTDMDRFLKTQLTMCWNGSITDPVWSRVDGTRPPQYTEGEYISDALAPFSEKVAEYLFAGPRQEERLKSAGHDWQGGPVARGWLEAKLVDYPAAKGGKQVYAEYGKRFLAKPENRAFLAGLAFEVTPPGYQAPQSPSEMKDMPHQ